MKTLIRTNWRSTLAGIAMILSAIVRIHSLADLSQHEIQAELLGGVGLICSADAKKHQNEIPKP